MDLSKHNGFPPLFAVAFIIVVLLALGMRLHHLDHESLWMDEIHQTSFYSDSFKDIIPRAASQQQPPLDYWIGHIVQTFSSSDFAVRLPAALFGTGSVVLLMFIVAKTCTWPIALATGTIMAMLPFHIYFSQEARPYSLPIFLLLALILSLNTVVQRDPPGIRHVLALLIVSIGFLHSRALVPLVVVSTTVLIILVRLALSVRFSVDRPRELQKQLLLASAILILSITIYLPALRLILEMGMRYAPEAPRLDLWAILEGISKFSFGPIWRAYIIQMEPLGWALLPLIVLGPVFAVKSWKKNFLIFATTFLLPIACVVHLVLFRAKTANLFLPRYPIYIFPLTLILVAFTCQRLMNLLRSMKRAAMLRGVLLIAVGLAIIVVGHRALVFKSVRKKTDWRALCHYLESSFGTEHVLIFDSLKPYNEWEPTFYGFGRYYKGRSPCLSVEKMPFFAHMMAEDTYHKPIFILYYPRDVFLTPYSEYPISTSSLPPFDGKGIKRDPSMTVTDFTGFSVIQTKKASKNLAKDTLRIMESLIATLPSDSSTVELHLAAASLAGALGLQGAEKHLAKAEALVPRPDAARVRAICAVIQDRTSRNSNKK